MAFACQAHRLELRIHSVKAVALYDNCVNQTISVEAVDQLLDYFAECGTDFPTTMKQKLLARRLIKLLGHIRDTGGSEIIKEFVEERQLSALVIVDLSASQAFGTGAKDNATVAAEIAAILTLAATASNDRAGLLLVTDRVEHFVPPDTGRRHALRLVPVGVRLERGRPVHPRAFDVRVIVPQSRGLFQGLGLGAPEEPVEEALRLVRSSSFGGCWAPSSRQA